MITAAGCETPRYLWQATGPILYFLCCSDCISTVFSQITEKLVADGV